MNNNHQGQNFAQSAPRWLRRIGVQSWLFIGIVLAAIVIFTVLATLNTLITPLLISMLFAILSRPIVDWLARYRVSRSLGAVLTMTLILAGLVGLLIIVVRGIIQQGPEITVQVQAGWLSLGVWLSEFNIQLPSSDSAMATLKDVLPAIFEGLFGFLGSTVSTLAEFFVGLYFSLFILFFFLRDTAKIEAGVAKRISLSPQVGSAIVMDAGQTVLIYFRGTALTALITSAVVAIPLIILKVPLVGAIMILYFVTSFIPYVGAWIAAFFAVLIALGSGGVSAALIVLTAVIISNGVLQAVVSSWALGSMLKMHPLVIFLVTIAAGIVGGILFMILAVPLTAIVVQVGKRLRQEGVFDE